MSGPYGPNETPGGGQGNNDPTQQWTGGTPAAPGAGPTQQWGGQQPPAQPTQQWGDQQPQGQWGQQPGQPQQPGGQPWGQSQPQWPQQGQPDYQQPGQQQPGQWGQSQPQWPQQGQPDYQQQPGQPWPQPGAQQPKKKTGLIIGAVIGAVVVVGAIIAGVFFLTAKDQLDNTAVQSGVEKVLKDSYGIEDVKDVSCPSGQKVEVDKTFSCDLQVGGEKKTVTIKITKDDGTYEVGRPS